MNQKNWRAVFRDREDKIYKSNWGPLQTLSDKKSELVLDRAAAIERARKSAKWRKKKGLRPLTPLDHKRLFGWPIDPG